MIIEREVDTYQSSVTYSTATQTEVKLVNSTAVVEPRTLFLNTLYQRKAL